MEVVRGNGATGGQPSVWEKESSFHKAPVLSAKGLIGSRDPEMKTECP